MSSEEKLFSFDAREMWNAFDWPMETKKRLLLRPDVVKPLSVDQVVWHSVFTEDSRLQSPPQTRRYVYDNLDLIKGQIRKGWGSKWRPCWLIGITAVAETVEQEKDLRIPGSNTLSPPKVDENWLLLGYDVVDRLFMLSGLLRCAYDPDEIDKVHEQWAPYLNEHNLFSDIEHALEFKTATDLRVVEHAPFVVYGIYLMEKHGSGDT